MTSGPTDPNDPKVVDIKSKNVRGRRTKATGSQGQSAPTPVSPALLPASPSAVTATPPPTLAPRAPLPPAQASPAAQAPTQAPAAATPAAQQVAAGTPPAAQVPPTPPEVAFWKSRDGILVIGIVAIVLIVGLMALASDWINSRMFATQEKINALNNANQKNTSAPKDQTRSAPLTYDEWKVKTQHCEASTNLASCVAKAMTQGNGVSVFQGKTYTLASGQQARFMYLAGMTVSGFSGEQAEGIPRETCWNPQQSPAPYANELNWWNNGYPGSCFTVVGPVTVSYQ